MKILIIDDNNFKRNEIIDTITSSGLISIESITECKNIIDAKRELRTNRYDVLLLDIKLPMRDSSEAISNAGVKLLKSFKFDRRYHQTKEIIGITAFEDEFDAAKDEFDESLLNIIQYSQVSDTWKNQLTDRLEYLITCEQDISEYDFDIAIVCALKNPELDAVLAQCENWSEYIVQNDRGTKYYETIFQGLHIIIASASQMGMPASTALSIKIINTFKPKYLFMSGICAGVNNSVKLGDIIVAEQSWDYGSGKIKKDGDKQIFQLEPYPIRLNAELKANVEELKGDNTIISNIQAQWKGSEAKINILNVHIGPLASGAAVIADETITQQLIEGQHRKLLGIEMEAYGVMYAAEHCPEPKPKGMVVKSVCDFADNKKNDDFHAYAAHSSASFIFEYIKHYCCK